MVRIRRLAAVGFVSLLSILSAEAQFHSKKQNGQTAVNQQAVNTAHRQAAAISNPSPGQASSHSQAGAALSGGDMILPDGKKQALAQWNPRIGRMEGKSADIWGRAIYHSDDSFTESKQDNENQTLEQITKSANGVVLQRRMVTLDRYGRPSEILIYDGRGTFKYRGRQIYDMMGRFNEEQLYSSDGTLIRRKVQEYTPDGQKKPLRSWDYVENIPPDLRLVITRENEEATRSRPNNKSDRPKLFGKQESANGTAGENPSSGSPQKESASAKSKNWRLGRMFSNKKSE